MKVEDWSAWQFAVGPTEPPTTRVYVRPGVLTMSMYWLDAGDQLRIEPGYCDFADVELFQVGYYASWLPRFAQPLAYVGAILCLGDYEYYWGEQVVGPDTRPFALASYGQERRTAAEAEADIEAMLDGNTRIWWQRAPLWAVILRSGEQRQVLPVDGGNRGRSYLWRDMRPRHAWAQYP